MDFDTLIYNAAIWVLPVLFALTLHEFAHGWMADRLGDTTARMLGRLSFNPLKHIDPIGTVAVPAVLLAMGSPFLFGWAKAIPVNTRNLRHYRRDMSLIAAAGPVANLLMAILWMLVTVLIVHFSTESAVSEGFLKMTQAGILINLVLFVLNLLPIPPLDGGRVLGGLVPEAFANVLDRVEPYGFFIVIALMISGVLDTILTPLVSSLASLLGHIFL